MKLTNTHVENLHNESLIPLSAHPFIIICLCILMIILCVSFQIYVILHKDSVIASELINLSNYIIRLYLRYDLIYTLKLSLVRFRLEKFFFTKTEAKVYCNCKPLLLILLQWVKKLQTTHVANNNLWCNTRVQQRRLREFHNYRRIYYLAPFEIPSSFAVNSFLRSMRSIVVELYNGAILYVKVNTWIIIER